MAYNLLRVGDTADYSTFGVQRHHCRSRVQYNMYIYEVNHNVRAIEATMQLAKSRSDESVDRTVDAFWFSR